MKIWLFKKIHKIDKPLAKLIRQKKKTKNMRVTNITNERGDIIQVLQIFGR